MHQVDAFFEVAFGQDFHPTPEEREIRFKRSGSLPEWLRPLNWRKVIAVHPNVSWPSRTLPEWFWADLVIDLVFLGYRVVSLGTVIDHDLSVYGAWDTRSRLHPSEQAEVISRAAAFVCCLSGLYVLSATTSTPVVMLNTISSFAEQAQWRHGVQGWKTAWIDAAVPCVGCQTRRVPGYSEKIFLCRYGHNDCVRSFDVNEVVDKVVRATRNGS